ncbi:hypothetical protein HMPREF0647_11090 [Prevotella bivia DNF00320]|uniref:Lipoprotein n=1 Tax=Prevotella bivia DNF00320 TaxID=1401068 RepID=A0A096BHI5_9BACT|nr:fimbrillin family protein [Prevotella bivia]KGF42177.1 hypothetical protein HMPREF0647_11090 [Prevotella bivia DNF00320]
MKAKLFISFAACVAASVLMSSCSNEESTPTNDQLTAFTGGILTEAPMERIQIGTTEISTVVPGFLTRTSMDRGEIGGKGAFLWEPGDQIYVEDDKNKLQKSQNAVAASEPRTTFLLGGSYTTKGQYDVYYCGTNTSAGAKKVVIAGSQTQDAFNNTKHFGAAGDCGVATATKVTTAGKSGYSFNLKHKASYLCFLPFMSSPEDRANYKIKSIEITSKETNISGTYDLSKDGLSGTGDAKTITLKVGTDGLVLADQTVNAESIKNSLYVVIAPGTHRLNVKFTVFDTKNSKELTLIKHYKTRAFDANKICDIPVSLGYADFTAGHDDTDGSYELEDTDVSFYYDGHNYYMWDAKENYWSGHEWDVISERPNNLESWQPTFNGIANSNSPQKTDAARWYNIGKDNVAFEASVNPLFTQLPNANEMAWYVMKGDAHWDESTRWSAFGRIHRGGIWLKKLSVIAKENNKNLADLKESAFDGTDWRTNSKEDGVTPKQGKPKNSEIDNYFFLPALGSYNGGQLIELGSKGTYWSSSTCISPSRRHLYAYVLTFAKDDVSMLGTNRITGYIAQPFK